jgi:hypothetical protein
MRFDNMPKFARRWDDISFMICTDYCPPLYIEDVSTLLEVLLNKDPKIMTINLPQITSKEHIWHIQKWLKKLKNFKN